MLDIGTFLSRDCRGMTRRAFVSAAASMPLTLGLSRRLNGSADTQSGGARSVIMVWLWGGPAQLDTFDPKPDAASEHRGPFHVIPTRTPGVQFSELLPRLAARQDRFAIVRSCYYQSANHHMLPLTGKQDGEEPNFGSIVSRKLPGKSLPTFVAISPETRVNHGVDSRKSKGFGAGRWGSAYHPFAVSCTPDSKVDTSSLHLLQGLTIERLGQRRQLLSEIDEARGKLDSLPEKAWDRHAENAYGLLAGKRARQAFDLSQETDKARAAYGYTAFGQSLLLARRLVEAEVPYVHVNWSMGVDALAEGAAMGWDTHRNGFEQLSLYHCPILDRALSALLDDLGERGLLSRTLVVGTGEMGRTPKINQIGGRDHWPTCSTFWAGGGVQGGRIIGETDRIAAEPITRRVTPAMIGTTIVDRLGVDAQARSELAVLTGGEVIHELF